MRTMILGLMMGVASTAAMAASSTLARYQDHGRVLVVSAPSHDDGELRRQLEAVNRENTGMRERDLVVLQLVGSTGSDDRGRTLEAASVRRDLSLPADRFAVVLIGKDGRVKLRSDDAIGTKDLFGTIDAMPMRRQEMRRHGG